MFKIWILLVVSVYSRNTLTSRWLSKVSNYIASISVFLTEDSYNFLRLCSYNIWIYRRLRFAAFHDTSIQFYKFRDLFSCAIVGILNLATEVEAVSKKGKVFRCDKSFQIHRNITTLKKGTALKAIYTLQIQMTLYQTALKFLRK